MRNKKQEEKHCREATKNLAYSRNWKKTRMVRTQKKGEICPRLNWRSRQDLDHAELCNSRKKYKLLFKWERHSRVFNREVAWHKLHLRSSCYHIQNELEGDKKGKWLQIWCSTQEKDNKISWPQSGGNTDRTDWFKITW